MFGVSIRSMLVALFGLMGLIIGGQGYLAVTRLAADGSVVDIATTVVILGLGVLTVAGAMVFAFFHCPPDRTPHASDGLARARRQRRRDPLCLPER